MTKFKVGDKVEVIGNCPSGFPKGTVGFIENDSSQYCLVVNNGVEGYFHKADELKLIEVKPKLTKNQRITALEETVQHMRAELDKAYEVEQDLLKRVSALEFVLAGNSKLTTNVKSVPQLNISKVVKSANEQRAEMIEKAKNFITDIKIKQSSSLLQLEGNDIIRSRATKTEFIINEEKRTVVALIKDKFTGMILARGISKCHPNDVFNEHIGKAIALGRALGLDVTEFEQVVQPNEVVTGQIIIFKELPSNLYRVDKRNGNLFNFTNLTTNEHFYELEYCEIEKWVTIINDTKSQYGGVE